MIICKINHCSSAQDRFINGSCHNFSFVKNTLRGLTSLTQLSTFVHLQHFGIRHFPAVMCTHIGWKQLCVEETGKCLTLVHNSR